MKYYIFDNGLEFVVSSDSTFKDPKLDVLYCVGEIVPVFSDYVKDYIDDGKIHTFEFLDKQIFEGKFSDAVLRANKMRVK